MINGKPNSSFGNKVDPCQSCYFLMNSTFNCSQTADQTVSMNRFVNKKETKHSGVPYADNNRKPNKLTNSPRRVTMKMQVTVPL